VHQLGDKRPGQPTRDLIADPCFGETSTGFAELDGQPSHGRQRLGQRRGHTVQLLGRKRRRVLQHAQVFSTMHDHSFGGRLDTGLGAAQGRQLLDGPIAKFRRRLIPGQAEIQPIPDRSSSSVLASAADPLSTTSVTVSRAIWC